jgi:hypothetical protein
MEDRLVNVRLITPHDHDFIYERPDKTAYKIMYRHEKEPTTEEIINYQGPLYAKHPDLNGNNQNSKNRSTNKDS